MDTFRKHFFSCKQMKISVSHIRHDYYSVSCNTAFAPVSLQTLHFIICYLLCTLVCRAVYYLKYALGQETLQKSKRKQTSFVVIHYNFQLPMLAISKCHDTSEGKLQTKVKGLQVRRVSAVFLSCSKSPVSTFYGHGAQ